MPQRPSRADPPRALLRQQRFAGSDAQRLEAIHRVAGSEVSVALASRGGYGLTRLLDQLDWALLARSVERGTRLSQLIDAVVREDAARQHGDDAVPANPPPERERDAG